MVTPRVGGRGIADSSVPSGRYRLSLQGGVRPPPPPYLPWSLSPRPVRTVQGCGLGEQWDRADIAVTSMAIHDLQGRMSSGSASPCQLSPGGIKRDFGAEDQRPTGDPGRSSIWKG